MSYFVSKNFATQENLRGKYFSARKTPCFISQTTLVQSKKMLIECCYFLSISSWNQLYPLFKEHIYLNWSFDGMCCYQMGSSNKIILPFHFKARWLLYMHDTFTKINLFPILPVHPLIRNSEQYFMVSVKIQTDKKTNPRRALTAKIMLEEQLIFSLSV